MMDLKQLAIFVGFCTAFGTIAAVLSTTSAEYTTGSWRPVNNDPDEPESIFEDEIFFMFSALLFYCFVLAPYGVYSYQLSATSGKSAVEHIQHVGRTRAALDGFHFPAKLLNSQGLVLHTRQWLPQKKPLGIAFLVHGYGEHVGRYEHVASTLTAAGLAVFGLDHQGHGQSEGERVHVERWDDFAEDLLLYVETVISGGSGVGKPIPSTWRSLPRFLVGHSMGGAITIRAAFLSRDRPIHVWAGVVLSGPCLVINPEEATPPLRFLAKTLSGIFPKLGITPGLGGIAVSRDPAVIESYDNDPLVYHGKMRINMGHQALITTDKIQKDTPEFDWPFLIMTGDADVLCMPEGTDNFYRDAGSVDKTCKHYPGLAHEIFNEPEKDDVLADVVEWIETRLR